MDKHFKNFISKFICYNKICVSLSKKIFIEKYHMELKLSSLIWEGELGDMKLSSLIWGGELGDTLSERGIRGKLAENFKDFIWLINYIFFP